MGKLLFWVLVFVVALIAWRLWNIRQWNARHRNDPPSPSKKKSASDEPMVRCARCGVFLPREEARLTHNGYRCGDEACNRHD
ncbi:MAG: hypothetical protein LBI16_04055 [Burkholderiales bacterium]|jgi:uncharacterized protein|nr:hypothetical protein [Burkholderiales bacterium]